MGEDCNCTIPLRDTTNLWLECQSRFVTVVIDSVAKLHAVLRATKKWFVVGVGPEFQLQSSMGWIVSNCNSAYALVIKNW